MCYNLAVQPHHKEKVNMLTRTHHWPQASVCRLMWSLDDPECRLAECTLALGRATSARGLHLSHYEHHDGSPCVRLVLQQLAAQHLQCLHLCFDQYLKQLAGCVTNSTEQEWCV
jgi:hypothetical protein